MLVLSRKLGERVLVAPNVWVTIVDIDRNKVRLGFDAPREVSIVREENLTAEQIKATKGGDESHASDR